MPKSFGKKDPFEDLDEDFKTTIEALNEEEVRKRIAQVALDQESLMVAKKADLDLEKAKEVAKEAGAIYRDGTKVNKLKISFARQVLSDRGKPT